MFEALCFSQSKELSIQIVYIGIGVVAFIVAFGIVQLARDSKDFEKQRIRETNRFFNDISEGIEHPRFFTNGHPYVWVDLGVDEMKKNVLEHPVGINFVDRLSLRIDKEKGHIFIVLGTNKYDFNNSNLVTYEEYVGENA